jgi:ABC-type proline/glycine betaine transport system substrate-binding protein
MEVTHLMKSKQKLFTVLIMITALLLMTVGAAGCARKEEPVVLKLADAGWDSIQLHNSIVSYILKNGYGVQTEQVTGTTPITWKALLENDIQIYTEVWSENIASYKEDLASGVVKEVSVNFDDNAQGLYVPRYVIEGDPERGIDPMAPDLKTVKDLLNYSDVFADPEEPNKGRIYGAISGWGVDKILSNKFNAYGFADTFNYFQPGSDAALAASLVSAYEKGEPWVGYYWAPTWISGQYDLVLLDDEPYTGDEEAMNAGLTAFPANRVTVVVNAELEKTHPEIVEFLSHYETSSALTAAGLAIMNSEGLNTDQAAIRMLKDHPELLTAWLTDANVKNKVTEALAKEA